MAFRVGQRIACINASPNKVGGLSPYYRDTELPVVGGIYTIRHLFCARLFGYDDVAILLVEVRNPVRRYITRFGRNVRCEPFFLSYRFRPLRTTSIDVFQQMLEPVPQEPAELVDA